MFVENLNFKILSF